MHKHTEFRVKPLCVCVCVFLFVFLSQWPWTVDTLRQIHWAPPTFSMWWRIQWVLYTLSERVCEREAVMSLSEGSPPAVHVCLSRPLSHHLVVLEGRGERTEGGMEKDEHTSCVLRESVCVETEKKKEGVVTFWKFKKSQSEWADEAGRKTKKGEKRK